jgi:spore coat polysaccharide biosynthesis predicted glycosyltransferase SpsG
MKSQGDSASALNVLIRCDGDPDLGLGHVVRCLALANELRGQHGCWVRFLIRSGPIAVQMAEKEGYAVDQPDDERGEDQDWMSRIIQEQRPDVLIMDFRAGLPVAAVTRWRQQGVFIVSIDDAEEKRIACDLLFYPPVPQIRRMDWAGFTGELHAGWEWILLRRQFAHLCPTAKKDSRLIVLVTMGGSDPAGLTIKAAKALDSLEEDFDTIIVVGGAFCHDRALEKILNQARRRFEVLRNVSNMAGVMAGADLAVASFCVTAYELATVGVPGIYLCLTEDHAESASAFTEAGVGDVLGIHTNVANGFLGERTRLLLKNTEARRKMASLCRQVSDGRGAQRIAQMVAEKAFSRRVHAGLQTTTK